MDRSERLRFKMSLIMQLSVIITYTVLNLIHLLNRVLSLKEITSSGIIFLSFNILFFSGFYIFLKVRRMSGEHAFFYYIGSCFIS